MSVLAIRIGAGVLALLALLTLRGKRWAYLPFVALGLAYFPAQTQFQVHAPKCPLVIPTLNAVVLSAQNYVAVALFAGFCWMSWVQFRRTNARFVWAVLATVVAGALVEIAEGMTGRGSCRVRDLVPTAAGALGVALVLALWSRLTRKPGYVRIGRPHGAAAPRQPVAPPRPVAPLGGIPTLPVEPRRVVPPPPDFSPTAAPTEEVAPIEERGVQREIVQRLGAIWRRLVAMLQQLWQVIRRRRRAIVVGIVVVLVVGVGAFVLLQQLPAPAAPAVVEQPKAPAPPPRPLQAEVEGYYEPDYQFSIGDRRFTRLTLRPQAFLTFARYGGRQESGCEEARIGQNAVFLRCDVERVGMVTIDGRFTSRYATSRLDAGVLSAVITVRNPRGEVLYRARDSFRWHEPE